MLRGFLRRSPPYLQGSSSLPGPRENERSQAPLEDYQAAQKHAPGKTQSPARETSAQLGAEEHVGVLGPWAQNWVPSRETAPNSQRRLGARQSVWNGSAKSRASSSVCWTRARSARVVARHISSFNLAYCWSKSTSWCSKATVSKVALKIRRPETIFLMVRSGPRSGLTPARVPRTIPA